MKRALLLLALTWALTSATSYSKETAQPDAVTAAKKFYQAYLKLNPSGLPTEEQMKVFSPLLSRELIDLIAAARREQQKFIKDNPDEKPPWIEGSLFVSSFEGAHSFTLGTPSINENKASIPVYLEYREGKTVVKWIDVIVLENADKEWRVWDIFMNAPWPFRSGPSLRAMLSKE